MQCSVVKEMHTNRECFQVYKAEDTVCVESHRVVDATSEVPRIPHRCCHTESRVSRGKPSVYRRTALPSVNPSLLGLAPVGCLSTLPSLATLLPGFNKHTVKIQ